MPTSCIDAEGRLLPKACTSNQSTQQRKQQRRIAVHLLVYCNGSALTHAVSLLSQFFCVAGLRAATGQQETRQSYMLAWDFQQLCTQHDRPASSHKKERCAQSQRPQVLTRRQSCAYGQWGSGVTTSTDTTGSGWPAFR